MISEKPLMRRLQALRLLTSKSYSVYEIATQLVSDGSLPKNAIHEIDVSYDKTETLFKFIELAARDGNIDLLDYEWKILPTQVLILTIVTPHAKREYRHEEA
jgi:hypothetical protein